MSKDEVVSYKPAMAFLAIRNSSGVDLLDPNLAGGIKAADIDIFVLENSVKKQILDGMLNDPERFKIYKSDNAGYILQLYFDVRKENLQGNKVTQFIRYKDGSKDKITAEFSAEGSYRHLTKVLINHIMKWPHQGNPSDTQPTLILK